MVDSRHRPLIFGLLSVAVALAAVIAVATTTGLDEQLSGVFFDPTRGRWLVDHDASRLRLWLYDGPKALVILLGVFLLCVAIRPSLLRSDWLSRRESIFLLACLAAVPLSVNAVRKHSNVQCPYTLQQYGGTQSRESGRVSLEGFVDVARPGGCWPSGHASGGFALLCLAFLKRRRPVRTGFALLGATMGLLMGAYQVARGAHFVSHILVTGLIAMLVILAISVIADTVD